MSAPRARAFTRQALINWLALAALVALGFLGPGPDVPGSGAKSAGTLQLAAATPD
ncbi:MAG TPA: hypothetical protein VEY89_07710 [Candidatus Dormibacteraeota bacterium]|nr:hypothetical protein [Candidatus Dormibacteraeota bacterium]